VQILGATIFFLGLAVVRRVLKDLHEHTPRGPYLKTPGDWCAMRVPNSRPAD